MLSLAVLLAFASSSFAYLVNVPNGGQGWGSEGRQRLEWSRVDTDSPSFAVVLTNQDRNILPYDIVLAKWVDGTRLYDSIKPPHGRFPTGDNFRVNLVQSASNQNTIYAQSSEFTIDDW